MANSDLNYTLFAMKSKGAGRFAPSPSGRMHFGNIFTAVMSWLDAKKVGAEWILRIEDLDPQRSKRVWAEAIENDLRWLGLEWDRGGLENRGWGGPFSQSLRNEYYEAAFKKLQEKGVLYPCNCSRADIMATQAPHQSDGRVVYSGHCRPCDKPPFHVNTEGQTTRLFVPDRDICFTDMMMGEQNFNLAHDCGDFTVRRADGAWSYQLAVVIDDSMMGVSRVVRGCDLLLSAAQQIYLYELLELPAPMFGHTPLICNAEGARLSKRDKALSMEHLRNNYTPGQILGRIGFLAGIIPDNEDISLAELFDEYKPIKRKEKIIYEEN